MGKPRTTDVAQQLAVREARTLEIINGWLPTTAERLLGYPPLKGSETADRFTYFNGLATTATAAGGDATLLQNARECREPAELWELVNYVPARSELRDRALLYLALEFGDQDAHEIASRLVRTAGWSSNANPVDRVYALAFADLLSLHPRGKDLSDLVEKIAATITRLGETAETLLAVRESLDLRGVIRSQLTRLSELSQIEASLDAKDADAAVANGLVVVPALAATAGSTIQKEIVRQFTQIAGVGLPIVTGDAAAARRSLLKRYPHFAAEIDLILRQRQPYRLLLIGSPGCGKTSLARDLADALGLASVVYAAGGSSDSSFAGTSSQWSTARASLPLQLILRSRIANPVVILDEVEKSGGSLQNGAFADAALTYLEPTSARRVLDPALEVEVDLAAVSYVATANSLDGVPAALRDRLRVIRMPDATQQHAPALIARILDDVAIERGIDRRWLQPLAADELELVHEAWPGGSLRRLRRVVELVVDGRERQMGRA